MRCEVDSITHEIILSFLGRVQLEVDSALLSEKYKLETVVKEPTVIYMERKRCINRIFFRAFIFDILVSSSLSKWRFCFERRN